MGEKEEEIDIEELLNTSQYIYMEEHTKFDSYDHQLEQVKQVSKVEEEEKM